MCAIVMRLGARGMGLYEIAARLKVSISSIQRWEADDEYPKFRVAMARAREMQRAWWEGEGRRNISNPMFNSQLFRLNMKARFGGEWSDRDTLEIRQNVVHIFNAPITAEEWEAKYLVDDDDTPMIEHES